MPENKPKSSITKKKEIVYSDLIRIGQLKANKNFFENEKQRFMTMYKAQIDGGKINEQQVNQIIHNTIVEKNIVEGVKQYLRPFFEVTIDEGEKNFVAQQIKTQVKDIPDDKIDGAASNVIYEKLLFDFLGSNEWKINVTDQEVNDMLDQHYKNTNQSIREFKENPAKFEEMRGQIFAQRVIREIIKRFKVSAEVELTAGLHGGFVDDKQENK